MPAAFIINNPEDIQISYLVGLETYKALYYQWPSLYSYISDPLTPTYFYATLVSGVVASSGLSLEEAGISIRNALKSHVDQVPLTSQENALISPLLGSSYKVTNLHSTPWANAIWIIATVFLSVFLIWYLYKVGFWQMLFNQDDGLSCYTCSSIFDRLVS